MSASGLHLVSVLCTTKKKNSPSNQGYWSSPATQQTWKTTHFTQLPVLAMCADCAGLHGH